MTEHEELDALTGEIALLRGRLDQHLRLVDAGKTFASAADPLRAEHGKLVARKATLVAQRWEAVEPVHKIAFREMAGQGAATARRRGLA